MSETPGKLNLSALLKQETSSVNPEWAIVKWEDLIVSTPEAIATSQITDTAVNSLQNQTIVTPAPTNLEIQQIESPSVHISVPTEVLGASIQETPQIQTPSIGNQVNFLAMKQVRTEEDEKKQEALKNSQNSTLNTIIEVPVAKELFWNYTPSFEWRAKKFFNQLREFRLKARTHIRILLWLCGLTFFVVWSAFYFFPEKHSLSIYKTSVLWVFTKNEVPIIKNDDIIPDTIPDIIPWTNSLSWSSENTEATKDPEIIVTPIIEAPKSEEWKEVLRREAIKKYFSK
jgi:hypothetical protein